MRRSTQGRDRPRISGGGDGRAVDLKGLKSRAEGDHIFESRAASDHIEGRKIGAGDFLLQP
jgi:hypothetical protein